MFHGTMIEELFEIVERAEEHAHSADLKSGRNDNVMYPAFLTDFTKTTHDWVGAF